MSKMKNYMMDIEEFCDGYFYGGVDSEFTIDEVAADVISIFGQPWQVTMRWIISREATWRMKEIITADLVVCRCTH